MAAGQGFKTFATGEVLTAADVNGYLMQGVLVFASAAARNAAITSPQEGQFAFTKDTNGLWYYDGAAWVASGATGDIEGVTAGVGISGGGTSGTVTITNSMATEITASGDIIVGTGSGTFDNLPIGTTNQVLTADTTVSPYKVKWATPAAAASGMTLISRQTASNVASLSMDSVFTSTYKTYLIVCEKFWAATASDDLLFNLRFGTTDKTSAYYGASGAIKSDGTGLTNTGTNNGAAFTLTTDSASSASNFSFWINQVGQGSGPYPAWNGTGFRQEQGNAALFFGGLCYASEAYSGIKFKSSSSNITIEVSIYGLAAS